MSKQTFRTVLKSFRKLVGSFYVIGTMPGPSKTSCWVVYRDWLNLPLVCCLQAESRISYCMIHTTRLLERGTWHIMTDMFLIFYLASEAGSSLEEKFGEKKQAWDLWHLFDFAFRWNHVWQDDFHPLLFGIRPHFGLCLGSLVLVVWIGN